MEYGARPAGLPLGRIARIFSNGADCRFQLITAFRRKPIDAAVYKAKSSTSSWIRPGSLTRRSFSFLLTNPLRNDRKESEMRTNLAENRTPRPSSYIPLPWDVFYEFARVIFAGCVVTFGPRRRGRRKLVQELELFHSSLSSFTLEARIPQNERDEMARLPYASQTGFSEDTARQMLSVCWGTHRRSC